MFSLIKKILTRARLFAALSDRTRAVETRLDQIDANLERFEKLADENAALWQYLDDEKEMEEVFVGSAEEFEAEFSDMMIRNMKTQGDA